MKNYPVGKSMSVLALKESKLIIMTYVIPVVTAEVMLYHTCYR